MLEGFTDFWGTWAAIQITCGGKKHQSFLEWILRLPMKPIAVYLHSFCGTEWTSVSGLNHTEVSLKANALKVGTWPQYAALFLTDNETARGHLRLEGYVYAVPECANSRSLTAFVGLLNSLTGYATADLYDYLPDPVWELYGESLKNSSIMLMPEDYLSYSVCGTHIASNDSEEIFFDGVSNGYGHFDVSHNALSPVRADHATLDLQLRGCRDYNLSTTKVDILAFHETGLTIVSDVDDVLRIAEIWDWNQMFTNLFLRRYVPWKNMPELYWKWKEVTSNVHFHYYSDAPEMSHDFYVEGTKKLYPYGTFGFRPMQIDTWAHLTSPRYNNIKRLIQTFPKRLFVLVGDTATGSVLSAYGALAHEFPDQVQCILIRDVSATEPANWIIPNMKALPIEKHILFANPEDIKANSVSLMEQLSNGTRVGCELDSIISRPYDTHELIDDVLRAYLAFATASRDTCLQSEYDIARYCYKLLDTTLFQTNQDYVRRQFLYCLLEEDDADTLHLAAALLLFDGRAHEAAFELLQAEGAFGRLVTLIRDKRDDDNGLYRLMLELLYEMSRIQKLSRQDLVTVDDGFVLYLFQLIEELSDDADDPYHYPIIRVLLVLNEQYMCLANAATSPNGEAAITNRVLKLLSAYGPSYRTFGENLILLLNREASLGPQLLILKLLYLLFTTPSTYEYFYTNDLHVLVDVIIRNLLDLDPGNISTGSYDEDADRHGQRALRHTYLRVLCPLLQNTQLAREGNNYKREEVRKVLHLLVNRSTAHFAPVDETVIRLVIRCKQIEWLKAEGDEDDREMERRLSQIVPNSSDVAKRLLGMSLEEAGVSSLSVVDVAAKVTKEKPSVPAPRRRRKQKSNSSHQKHDELSHGGLQVPSNGLDDSQDGGQSPFADDNEES